MSSSETTCPRHRDTATRLSCTRCGSPICPRCAIDVPVGQVCPDCARQQRGATAQGKPRQYRKATAAGAATAVLGGLVLPAVLDIPFAGLIATGVLGYAIAHAVLFGAEGNRAGNFRNLAIGFALVMVAGGFTVWGGSPLTGGLRTLLVYAAAAYGAYLRFDR